MNKEKIFNKYLSITEPSYIKSISRDDDFDICDKCNMEMSIIYNEGIML